MGKGLYAVIGLGLFGSELARSLSEKGHGVIAIDHDNEAIDRVKSFVDHAIVVDSTSDSFLNYVPLNNVDRAVVAITAFEASLLTIALLKQAGIPYIVARAQTMVHGELLKKIGANEVITIEVEQAHRLAHRLTSADLLDRTLLGSINSISEVATTNFMVNRRLDDIDLGAQFDLKIIAIRRSTLEVSPRGEPIRTEEIIVATCDALIDEGDILLVVGRDDKIRGFKEQ